MSLFSWLSPAKKSRSAPPESSGLSRMDSTKPYPSRQGHEGANGQPANRKSERIARRELLYQVVREAMTKAGVLSASYKFKVLSLDPKGQQFLVMVDLAREYGTGTSSLAEIEAMVAQAAKARFGIVVTAVYWRMNEHVAVGINTGPHHPRQVPISRPSPLQPEPDSQPAALSSAPAPLTSGPAPLVAQPAAAAPVAPLASGPKPAVAQAAPVTPAAVPAVPPTAPMARAGGRFEPIHNDEVEAFKKALATGVSASDALAAGAKARDFEGSAKHGPQSYTLLTGFEDTEMPEADPPTPAALSATQYGDLR